MKKSTYLLVLLAFLMLGCTDNVEFNNPAMQANQEGETWKADFFAADIDFGGFLFEGRRGAEVLQLIASDDRRGSYEIGPETGSVAIFKDADGTIYSTNNMPDPSISVYPGEGFLEVTDVDDFDPKRVIGNFWFNAYSEDGLRSVNFIGGVLYKVSLTGGLLALPD
ncbi:DUF6252 family protein [Winogradskyella maritima]|uniref:DUF6252 family protein n=1 Tax=Winogradskyella maritima TaxID=1517766 RepID=A0ABV8AFF1_9FLAO|nr:DUF6252 family protein [Winogradskyella maritima]